MRRVDRSGPVAVPPALSVAGARLGRMSTDDEQLLRDRV